MIRKKTEVKEEPKKQAVKETPENNGVCPILVLGFAEKYGLTNDYIFNWCNKGCQPNCAERMKEEIEKGRTKNVKDTLEKAE